MATNFELNTESGKMVVEQFFKTDKKSGQRRAPIKVELSAPETSAISTEQISVLACELVAAYAKKLIAANGENWEYLPTDADCNFQLAYADLVAPSDRGFRKLPAEVLAELIRLYAIWGTEAGKTQVAISNGQKILKSRLKDLLGIRDESVLVAFAGNLDSFCAWITSQEHLDAKIELGAEELVRMITEMIEAQGKSGISAGDI